MRGLAVKGPLLLAASTAVAVMALAVRPASVGAQAPGSELTSQCASCHALTKPADATLDRLWSRKGPDLWYAGDKFNRDWLVAWLQKPTVIRPGGVLWFKHAKPGEPRDTIDSAAVEKHPAVDAATARKGDRVDVGARHVAIIFENVGHARTLDHVMRQREIERRQRERAVVDDLDRLAAPPEHDDRTEGRIVGKACDQFARMRAANHRMHGHALDARLRNFAPDARHHLARRFFFRFPRHVRLEHRQRLRDRLADRHARIEARQRILEHDL